jgi:hypothetical protein
MVYTYVNITSDVEDMPPPICRRPIDTNISIAFGVEKMPPHKFSLGYFKFSFSACFPFINKLHFNYIIMPPVCGRVPPPPPFSTIFLKK